MKVELQTNLHPLYLAYCETIVQRSAKRFVRGCEKFVTALAYRFCLALAVSCLARFAYFLADLCTYHSTRILTSQSYLLAPLAQKGDNESTVA